MRALPTPELRPPRAGRAAGKEPRPGPAALGRALGMDGSWARGRAGLGGELGTGETWARVGAGLGWELRTRARREPPDAAAAQSPRSCAPPARPRSHARPIPSCSLPAAGSGPHVSLQRDFSMEHTLAGLFVRASEITQRCESSRLFPIVKCLRQRVSLNHDRLEREN